MKQFVRQFARIGTGLCLVVLIFSCARVPTLKEESGGSYIRLPFVRVLLDETSREIKVGADKSFAIECIAGGQQKMYYSSQPVTVINRQDRLTVTDHRRRELARDLDEVNIIARTGDYHIRVDGKQYRGLIKLMPTGATVRTINIVYMEDYLRGVVPPEIGPVGEDAFEAIKAQAVAARTYAMGHLKQYGGQPYDLKASIIDQVYQGLSVENKLTNSAIDFTAGNVLYHQDDFPDAYYHSTCGGATDDIEHVWERKEVPYLKSVRDNGACSWSKYYNWQEAFSEEQLRNRLEQYLSTERGKTIRLERIVDVVPVDRTPGGRISLLLIQAGKEVLRFRKDRIRWVIGRTSNPDLILPSARFDVDLEKDRSGNIRRIIFRGSGYGHGVGMCQCGAIGMARNGRPFDTILKHYYTGVSIKKLY